MAKKQSESVSDRLTRLLAERERYAQWLEKLETERDSTPDNVYDRVRDDYTARLEETTEQLGSHLEAIESTLDTRREKLETVSEVVDARTDELLEAEVRFRVGELDEEEWEEEEEKLQAAVAKAERKRDKVEADIERLETALERIREAEQEKGAGQKTAERSDEQKEQGEARPEPLPFRTVECTRCGTFNVEDATHCEACGTELATA